jgi:uncharacterized protein
LTDVVTHARSGPRPDALVLARAGARIAGAATIVAAVFTMATHAQAMTLATIHGYQRSLAPLAVRAGARCRFTPSCSHYAEAVITRDGVVGGGWKAMKRIARCGPWTRMGTRDEP